ncbi:MAG: phosphotransferase [Parvibaculaceae bacterium]
MTARSDGSGTSVPGRGGPDYPVALVAHLLKQQHPDFASLPIIPAAQGFENAIYRLGQDYAVRLPRSQRAAQFAANEQKWMPDLAPSLAVPVTVPLRTGQPSPEFEWPWSIVRWLPGTDADRAPPHAAEAAPFAAFLTSLHRRAPDAALPGYGDLTSPMIRLDFDEAIAQGLQITDAHREIWALAREAPVETDPTWIHGDLHGNILVQEGRISGILDWTHISRGDPASDLAGIWSLFEEQDARMAAISAYAAGQATLRRAKGWALYFACTICPSRPGDGRAMALARKVLTRLDLDHNQGRG